MIRALGFAAGLIVLSMAAVVAQPPADSDVARRRAARLRHCAILGESGC